MRLEGKVEIRSRRARMLDKGTRCLFQGWRVATRQHWILRWEGYNWITPAEDGWQ